MSLYKGDKLIAGGSQALPLLFHTWADHLFNHPSWLRADTFSWHYGSMYQAVYAHLVADIEDKTLQSETVGDITIQFYLADDGHKICPDTEALNVLAIYNTTGVAWYYIIDTVNERFKLPRTKFGFTGLRDKVGGYVEPGLPNITGTFDTAGNGSGSGAFAKDSHTNTRPWDGTGLGTDVFSFNASRSNSIYGNGSTVQQPATQMYLYFYVGEFTQTALENTAGITAETLNGKADINAQNFDSTGKAYLAGLAMPSDTYDDLTLGASGATYIAPGNGWLVFCKQTNGTNQYAILLNTTTGVSISTVMPATTWNIFQFLPAKKGDIITVSYSASGALQWFRFVYAQGEI